MPKIEPAVRQLLYIVPDGVSYIDLAKDLSKVNRRLYRQGMSYVIQDIQVGVSNGMKASDVWGASFSTAGNSWIVHNAWKKGFAAWRDQQREITRALGSDVSGKWADYKIYLDDTMEDGTILEPYASDNAVYLAGEWEHSKLVFDDDGTEREFKMHLVGSSNLADTNEESGIGLIYEYNLSRRRIQSPDPSVSGSASDSIYSKLFATDEMSDMMVDNIEGDNDNPPYDHDEMPGGATNADAAVINRFVSCSANQTTVTVPGFVAECGLVRVFTSEQSLDTNGFLADASTANGVYASGTASNTAVLITVAPGPYRGVLAAPMGQ